MGSGLLPRNRGSPEGGRFQYRRQGKGDHETWHSPITDRTLTVDKGSLSRHTANAAMKQAGLDKRF